MILVVDGLSLVEIVWLDEGVEGVEIELVIFVVVTMVGLE